MGEYKGIWVVIVRDYQNSRKVTLCFGVWHRLGVCNLSGYPCSLKIHITHLAWELGFEVVVGASIVTC